MTVTPLASKRYQKSNEEEKNEYENFIILPEIRKNVSKVDASMSSENSNFRLAESSNVCELPPIDR